MHTTTTKPSRAERAALAASLPPSAASPRLTSRADILLDAYDPATASRSISGQVQALQNFKAAYWRVCDLAHSLECLSGNPEAVYEHKNQRENLWLMKHAHGSRKYLPWTSRWPDACKDGLRGFVTDQDRTTDVDGNPLSAWVIEVRSRIAKTVPSFDTSIDDLCVSACACLTAGLTKILVYEYVFDMHQAWIDTQAEGVGLPWYWTKPRRL